MEGSCNFAKPCKADGECGSGTCFVIPNYSSLASALTNVIESYMGIWSPLDGCPAVNANLGQWTLGTFLTNISSYWDGTNATAFPLSSNAGICLPVGHDMTTAANALLNDLGIQVDTFNVSIWVDRSNSWYADSGFNISLGGLVGVTDPAPTPVNIIRAGAFVPTEGAMNLLHATCDSELYLLRGSAGQQRVTLPRLHLLAHTLFAEVQLLAQCRDVDYMQADVETRYFVQHLGMWLALMESSSMYSFPHEYSDLYSNLSSQLQQRSLYRKINLPTGCRLTDWLSTGTCRVSYSNIGRLMGVNMTLRLTLQNCANLPNAVPEIYLDCFGTDCETVLNPTNMLVPCSTDADCLSGYTCDQTFYGIPNSFEPMDMYFIEAPQGNQCFTNASSDLFNIFNILKGDNPFQGNMSGVCQFPLMQKIMSIKNNGNITNEDFILAGAGGITVVGLDVYSGPALSNSTIAANSTKDTGSSSGAGSTVGGTSSFLMVAAALLAIVFARL